MSRPVKTKRPKKFRPLNWFICFLITVTDKVRDFISPVFIFLVLIGISIYAFVLNEQGTDFLFAILENEALKNINMLFLEAAVTVWGFVIWYCARLILYMVPLSIKNEKLNYLFTKYIPRVLGLAPFIVLAVAFLKLNLNVVLIFITLGVIYFLTVTFRRNLFLNKDEKDIPLPDSFEGDAEEVLKEKWKLLKIKLRPAGAKLFLGILLLFNFLLLVLSVIPGDVAIVRDFTPGLIIVSAFIFFTILLSFLSFFNDSKCVPIFLSLLVWIILCSYPNDNSRFRYLENTGIQRTSDSIPLHFSKWINYKIEQANRDSFQKFNITSGGKKIYPVVIIASEGGGIRAFNWTVRSLQVLDSVCPDFYKHIYAMSGVSGGGVGALVYSALRKDFGTGKNFSEIDSSAIRQILSFDYLSNVVNSFIYGENLQRIIPYPLDFLSRNNKIEDALSYSYEKFTGRNTLEGPFLSLWNESSKYEVPNLFLNGTIAESGQKIIHSNLPVSSTYFQDAIDHYDTTNMDIRLKTAAFFCARFPVITSGGKISTENTAVEGHVVDGGYKEGTGMETAISVFNSISRYISDYNKSDTNKYLLAPFLLYFKNSPLYTDTVKYNFNFPIKDLTTIAKGLISTYSRGSYSFENNVSNSLQNFGGKLDFGVMTLDREGEKIPLGWYLSHKSCDTIKMRTVSALDKSKSVQRLLKIINGEPVE